MKNWLLIIFLLSTAGFITACHSGSATGSGKDTVKNVYGSAINDTTNVSKKNIDTSKVTDGDNSASGGTNAIKDTGKAVKK